MLTMNRGRPKSFDDDDALERAMRVFWRSGYDATSLDDLLNAMSIPRQSLYRTFGNKRSLFLKALDLYGSRMNMAVTGILNADGTASDNINELFKFWNERLTLHDSDGCMMQNTCGQSMLVDKQVTALVISYQSRITDAFEQALSRGQLEGNINNTIDTRGVACTITASINGLLAYPASGRRPSFAMKSSRL